MRLSARGYHRVLRVARTLADLDGVDAVKRIHIAEALSYGGWSSGPGQPPALDGARVGSS
jgi:magnesium chelatase family protein